MAEDNKMSQVKYHLINSALAGALVLLGSLTDGNITIQGVILAIVAALIVAISKFKEWFDSSENNISRSFSFI